MCVFVFLQKHAVLSTVLELLPFENVSLPVHREGALI